MKRLTLLFIAVLLCLPSFDFAQESCPTFTSLPSRLSSGMQAQVTEGSSNNVRVLPSRDAEKVGELVGGTLVTVLDGPVCANDLNWLQIQAGDLVGWTVESVDSKYALEPITAPSFSEEGIAFEVPFVDQFDGDLLKLDNIAASNMTPDAVRIADKYTGIFELNVMSAAQIERRQPGIVEALQNALFADAPDDLQRLLTANVLDPTSKRFVRGEIDLNIRRDSQVIEGDAGRFYRFLTPFRIYIAYVAYGLMEDGELVVSAYMLLPADSFSQPTGYSFDEQLANLTSLAPEEVAPYLQELDNVLQSLVVPGDTLQAVTDAALATPKPPVCGLYPPRLWIGELAISEFEQDSIRIRDAAGGAATGQEIGPRGEVTVLEGPVCVDAVNWWRIESADPQAIGWIAEANENGYFVYPWEYIDFSIYEPTNEPPPLPTPTVSVVCNHYLHSAK